MEPGQIDFYTVHSKPFRELYFRGISLSVGVIALGYVLVGSGALGTVGYDAQRQWSTPVLLATVVLSVFFGYYNKKQLEKIHDLPDFEDQVKAYERQYRISMYWRVGSCAFLVLMLLLTLRWNFFYYSLLELLVSLFSYPTQKMFKIVLRNEEIVVVK